ncbi:histidinol-phosphatase [Yunchengibacter salinarum]|uniref:histidinol-phosphatase n=1 Tax=Yunchengibacter salinarum TaxID=3133399 RepID=UPI0035B59F9E
MSQDRPALPAEDITALARFAERLADAAAAVTLPAFRRPHDVTNKESGGFDPVTAADRGAEEALRALIEAEYPDHAIHGEEFGHKTTDSRFQWVLDPIDGTRSFITGVPLWGTLIALKLDGEPLIGVIDQPYLKERFVGTPDGTTLNGTPIRTRACRDLSTATLITTDPDLFDDTEYRAFRTVRAQVRLTRYGMDCYAYALLALGQLDVVVEAGLEPYDMMALIPVVRGAGGVITDWHGNTAGDSHRLLALSDPALMGQVLPHLAHC